MATGQRTTDTFSEGLRKLLSQLTDLKLTEGVDLPFVIQLETQIIHKINEGVQGAMQPQGQSGGMPGMGGGPAGLMGSPAPPPGMGSPQMVPGLQQGPNPDELRRVLTQR